MDEEIEEFLAFLSVEKGFSNNTRDAYRNDLSQFAAFVREQAAKQSEPQPNWKSIDRSVVLNYMVSLRERSYAPATIARKVAAIKYIFNLRITEDTEGKNLTEGLTGPKVGKSLPKAISVAEVERLLEQPDKISTPEALSLQ